MLGRIASFHLESHDFPAERLHLRSFEGREVIGELFSIDIEAVIPDRRGLDVAALVGADASLVLERDGIEVRRFFGMIAGVRDRLDPASDHRSYLLRLVPRASRLRLVQTQDIYQDLSVPDIISAKLGLVGLGEDDVEMRLMGEYARREFVVQYRETDIAFVSRLCEHLGIGFFFEHQGAADRIVFTDHEVGYPLLGEAHFRPAGDQCDVFSLEIEAQVVPRTYAVSDYNYRIPQVSLSGVIEAQGGYGGGVVEYGAHVKSPEESQALALVRSEEYQGTQQVYHGQSDLGAFRAGARIQLEGHPLLEHPKLLLVEVTHRGSQPVLGHGDADKPTYRNTFRAVPAGFTYRPPRITPRPRIYGLLTGTIEAGLGGSAEFARIDDEGRYTVRFHFDTASDERQKASRPVRMAQPHVGPGYGMHFPLKPGVEVVLAFIDGDPDRPIIVGAVPNPLTPSPVIAENSKENVIRSVSGARIRIIDG